MGRRSSACNKRLVFVHYCSGRSSGSSFVCQRIPEPAKFRKPTKYWGSWGASMNATFNCIKLLKRDKTTFKIAVNNCPISFSIKPSCNWNILVENWVPTQTIAEWVYNDATSKKHVIAGWNLQCLLIDMCATMCTYWYHSYSFNASQNFQCS